MQLTKSKDIIVSYLQRNGDSSRILLSKETGLTKAAITQITNELIKEGILIEKGEIQPIKMPVDENSEAMQKKRGRRKVLIGINENYRLALGFVVLSDGIYAGLCNLKGEILQKIFVNHVQEGRQGLLELFVKTYEYLLKENCITADKLLGLGICTSEDSDGVFETELSVEQMAKLKTELSHAIDVPIVVCRLAEGMLLAQRLFMKERKQFFESAVMLLVGTSCGVSLFANGRIYKGFSNQAGGLSLVKKTLENFEALALSEDSTERDEQIKRLFEFLCFFDPQMVFAFGEFSSLEQEVLEKVNSIISSFFIKKKKPKQYDILACDIKKETIFLSGAAAIASQNFFKF